MLSLWWPGRRPAPRPRALLGGAELHRPVALDQLRQAAALVNTSQEVGGSIGTALLSTVAASATTDFVTEHGPAADVLRQAGVEGYVTGFSWAAGIFAAGAVMTGCLLRSGVRPAAAEGVAAEPAIAG